MILTQLHDVIVDTPGRAQMTDDDCSRGDQSRQHTRRSDCETRRALPADADTIVAVLTAARAKQAFIPPLHTTEDVREFVRTRTMPANEVWVVEDSEVVVGFAPFGVEFLGHLYVAPAGQGRGIGRALLDRVK
jgi:GNAT superfamily N-acetyltransferase